MRRDALIGIGAIVMDDAVVEEEAFVGAGSFVRGSDRVSARWSEETECRSLDHQQREQRQRRSEREPRWIRKTGQPQYQPGVAGFSRRGGRCDARRQQVCDA